MKELFREQDITRVSYYKAVLEDNGIPTTIRNEHLTGSGLTEIPIPEFFPALCVQNDEDYVQAVTIIRKHLTANQKNADTEITCISCGATNPGNFEICWSCGNLVSAPQNSEVPSPNDRQALQPSIQPQPNSRPSVELRHAHSPQSSEKFALNRGPTAQEGFGSRLLVIGIGLLLLTGIGFFLLLGAAVGIGMGGGLYHPKLVMSIFIAVASISILLIGVGVYLRMSSKK